MEDFAGSGLERFKEKGVKKIMKLYLFKTSNFFGSRLEMEEFEVEEKAKTYVCKGRRFRKDDVGQATGYENTECFLLENNPAKACEVLLYYREMELKGIKTQLSKKEAQIENLKKYITQEDLT